jgi:hypothetical protein
MAGSVHRHLKGKAKKNKRIKSRKTRIKKTSMKQIITYIFIAKSISTAGANRWRRTNAQHLHKNKNLQITSE